MRVRWAILASAGIAGAVVAGVVCVKLLRPAIVDKLDITLRSPTAQALQADTLSIRRGAIGYLDPADGRAKCRTVGDDATEQRATASLAKLITVQVVLDKYPLKESENGPTITTSTEDEARYWHEVQTGGSYGRVVAGEQLSERQLIEGIMLVSANNMADSLAIWAFGSLEKYQAAAAAWLKSNDLADTTVGTDASGLDATTTSTPADLCRIALLAAKQPALVKIMSESSATMPTGDVFTSTNRLLGQDGIFGGKTGYNEAAGRGVILLARHNIDDTNLTTVSVSLGNDSYNAAFDTAQALNKATTQDTKVLRVRKGQRVGNITTKWGSQTKVTANRGLVSAYFADTPPTIYGSLYRTHDITSGVMVGELLVGDSSVALTASSRISAPSIGWLLIH